MSEPLLGLATTEELLREVIARLSVTAITVGGYDNVHNGLLLAEMIGRMDSITREYRTVDDD